MKARHEFVSDEEYQKYLKVHFAAMAMQGILSASADRGETYVATKSLTFSDALIDELNKTAQ